MRKRILSVACMVLAGVMTVTAVRPLKATSIEDERNKQQQLEQNIESAQQILADLEKLKEDTTAYIAEMDERMEELTNYIIELNARIADKEGRIDEINVELDAQQKDIEEQYEAMKKRIKFLYENGQTDYIDMLLNSHNMSDLINKAEYLTKITEYDRNMLNKLKETKEKIELNKNTLVEEKTELDSMSTAAKDEQEEVQKLVEAKAQLLLETNEQIDAKQEEVLSMEGELVASKAIEAELVEQEKIAKALAAASGYYSNVTYTGDKFKWPLQGYYNISSGFVHRINPVTNQPENHSGIDIPAPAGTPVMAGADGVVAWAYRSGSAGNWVGIDHGNGIMTVYMHMSAFNCTAGDTVKRGDTIGFVGSTGQSTGNHLHFSVRVDGSYVNPINFLGN